MFQSIFVLHHDTNMSITIIDSTFTETIIIPYSKEINFSYYIYAIVFSYSKRNLNVAKNLFLYFQYMFEKEVYRDFDEFIFWLSSSVDNAEQYIFQIKKYLNFS